MFAIISLSCQNTLPPNILPFTSCPLCSASRYHKTIHCLLSLKGSKCISPLSFSPTESTHNPAFITCFGYFWSSSHTIIELQSNCDNNCETSVRLPTYTSTIVVYDLAMSSPALLQPNLCDLSPLDPLCMSGPSFVFSSGERLRKSFPSDDFDFSSDRQICYGTEAEFEVPFYLFR